jgi:hypothetical protein
MGTGNFRGHSVIESGIHGVSHWGKTTGGTEGADERTFLTLLSALVRGYFSFVRVGSGGW